VLPAVIIFTKFKVNEHIPVCTLKSLFEHLYLFNTWYSSKKLRAPEKMYRTAFDYVVCQTKLA